MIVDYLVNFYRMPIHIWVGGQEYKTWIRWYRAPAGAKRFPHATVFRSHVWMDRRPIPLDGPGEVGHPRVFDRGLNPGYQGQCFRGLPEWYETGHLPGYIMQQIPDFPCGCQINPQPGLGGIVLGGQAIVAAHQPAVSKGGLVFGGQADASGGYPAVAKGGIILGGSAVVTEPPPVALKGGMVWGGAAAVPAVEPAVGAGGLVFGGDASMPAVEPATGMGGWVFGGSAYPSFHSFGPSMSSGSSGGDITGCLYCPDGAAPVQISLFGDR